MRLHHLRITAFGPFADTVEIDFDELSAAGLFLLTGPTGAGKSSVLDAVCFALYGDVPGDRATAKRLRSDQAAPGTAPQVMLESTLSGRRFRFTRSPSWTRAKLRGTGTTTVPAKVVVEERVHGAWIARSTRLDEAGHLIGDLTGLTMGQFCQVAMLPQGRFSEFLRARPDDRQRLLERLFRTQRFTRIETWLRDHRLDLQRASRDHETTVAGLLNRLSETASVAVPADVDLVVGVQDGTLPDFAEQTAQAADERAVITFARHREAAEAERTATEALEAARDLAERQQRLRRAQDALAAVLASAQAHQDRRDRHQRAVAARAIEPVLALAEEAEAAARRTRDAAEAARSAVPEPAREALETARAEAHRLLQAASAAVVSEEALSTTRQQVASYARDLTLIEEDEQRLHLEATALPDQISDAEAAGERARQAAAEATRLAEALADLTSREAAWQRAQGLSVEREQARDAAREAVDAAHHAQEQLFEVREARLQGMAAEIAGGLAAGCACPVCGSGTHPDPARPGPEAVGAEDERAARRRLDDANAVRFTHTEHVRDLGTRLALALAEAGEDPESLTQRRGEIVVRHAAAQRSAEEAPALVERVRALRERAEELRAQAGQLALRRAGITSANDLAKARIDELAGHLANALDGTEAGTAQALHQHAEESLAAIDAAVQAQRAAEAADAEATRTGHAAETALADTVFTDAGQARSAFIPRVEVDALAEQIAEHAASLATAQTTLADPALAGVGETPAPDLAALDQAHRQAREDADAAHAERSSAGARATRVRSLAEELAAACTRWRPLLDDLALATSLSGLVDGRSADNRLQMRLSAYVLAYRLTQVVDAANERLHAMSDSRYRLERTDHRGAGENRGGLSLLVRDDWTGESRDPATLSGGETFVVSLALALGLADVLTHQSDSAATGDARLDTLFVDEGFGSLDADTLEDVLDTLDGLREGGRVVGVVSHVAEMRERIGVRLEVTKDPRGSRVSAYSVESSGATR